MTGRDHTVRPEVHDASLSTRVLQGLALAVFMTLFRVIAGVVSAKTFSIDETAILFGSVSLGGAAGGAAYYATDHLRAVGGWRKTVANVVSLLVYCLATLLVFVVAWRTTHGALFE